jgi:Brp/Blh family beta-carotene 15,15'-monooxygenase
MLLLLPFVLNAGEISASHQLFICTPLILFLGIPHGAIDNVLFIRNKEIKNYEFIGIYLVFVSLNVGLWIIFPSLGYILFLLLSAYHFGQSQFSHYFERQPLSHLSLYLFWGISILSGLVYFNIEEIQQIMSNQAEFAVFSPLHQENHMLYTLLFSTGVTLLLMVFLTLKGSIRFETFFMEFLVLSLIQICYFLMPLLIGFTLYFVLLHSFKVLREEYLFLNSENEVKSLGNFIKLVTPFTLFSIVGIAFLFGLIYLNILTLPYGYVLLIVISSITLPHVFVMNRFYSLLFSKRLSSKVIKA